MNSEKLEIANYLDEQIKLTEHAIEQTYLFNEPGPSYKNEIYHINISEYSDGSGESIDLKGLTSFNSRFLSNLKKELEDHLKKLRTEFEEL